LELALESAFDRISDADSGLELASVIELYFGECTYWEREGSGDINASTALPQVSEKLPLNRLSIVRNIKYCKYKGISVK
jgi:hypothetical protein